MWCIEDFQRQYVYRVAITALFLGNIANFQKYEGHTFGLPYDLRSVMHYQSSTFAKDQSSWTIRPKNRYRTIPIGQRDTLSKLDVKRINKLYECQEANQVKVCGYLWTKTKYQGIMTVIYEAVIYSYYEKNERYFASAEVVSECEVRLYTEDAPEGVTLSSQKYPKFQRQHRSRATRLECFCNNKRR